MLLFARLLSFSHIIMDHHTLFTSQQCESKHFVGRWVRNQGQQRILIPYLFLFVHNLYTVSATLAMLSFAPMRHLAKE